MELLVNNLQDKVAVDEALIALIRRVVEETLDMEGYGQDAEVSLVFVDDSYIQELNRTYRGMDKPTDVLSFPMLEDTGEEPDFEEHGEILLGDIIISLERARLQAEEYGHSFEREVAFLTIHGMLHLLGYDHEEEKDRLVMREREEALLGRLNIHR